ncbi:unnamed protein product [Amoebophrya sp. A120]|nr:unnamed protein product [Amoebophrya sp. A120]|eukprot:GSA120T00023802001.1
MRARITSTFTSTYMGCNADTSGLEGRMEDVKLLMEKYPTSKGAMLTETGTLRLPTDPNKHSTCDEKTLIAGMEAIFKVLNDSKVLLMQDRHERDLTDSVMLGLAFQTSRVMENLHDNFTLFQTQTFWHFIGDRCGRHEDADRARVHPRGGGQGGEADRERAPGR